jgi:hypothetical protein
MAGAGTIAPAATAVADLRKSRRFIERLQNVRGLIWTGIAIFVPTPLSALNPF